MDAYDLTENERAQLGRMHAAAGRIWWECRVVFPWLPGETGRTLCVLGDGLPLMLADRADGDAWRIGCTDPRMAPIKRGDTVALSRIADAMEDMAAYEVEVDTW